MARPERPIDPTSGPVAAFAYDLRLLRIAAGSPSYRQLAARVHFSATTLSKAASGETLPSLDVALAYVQACNADVEQWRQRWYDVDAHLRTGDAHLRTGDAHLRTGDGHIETAPAPGEALAGPDGTGGVPDRGTGLTARGRTGTAWGRLRRPRFVLAATAGVALILAVWALLPDGPRAHGTVPSALPSATAAPAVPCVNGPGAQTDAVVPPGQYPVRHNEVYALCPGTANDLDLDSLSANWIPKDTTNPRAYDLEFTLARRTLVGNLDAVIAIIDHPTYRYQDCSSATAYGTALEPTAMRSGTEVCVITSERRRSMLIVQGVRMDSNDRPDRLVLDITTWNHVIDQAS